MQCQRNVNKCVDTVLNTVYISIMLAKHEPAQVDCPSCDGTHCERCNDTGLVAPYCAVCGETGTGDCCTCAACGERGQCADDCQQLQEGDLS